MRLPLWRLRGAALVLGAAVAACAGDATAPGTAPRPDDPPAPAVQGYLNPVYAGDFPDPFILGDGRFYYAFATNTGGANVPFMRSVDFVHWDPLGDALPVLPPWAAAGRGLTWAPAVLRRGGRWVLFYTARDARRGRQCIGRAVAASPAGPIVDASVAPFLCQRALGGSIDPAVFADADGALYLLWKNDGNCCGAAVSIWSQRLTDDATALVGPPARRVDRDRAWEGRLVEGPALWAAGGRYYLFYSANDYATDRYAVGYALCASPLGPCAKPGDAPILASAPGAAGPGGQSLFADARGDLWMAYHAWGRPVGYGAGGVRSLRVDRVAVDGDAVVIRGPTTTPQPLP
jgi:beta-xylosidase